MSGNADEREQINKNKNLNDECFDFECPNIRITRSYSKQKQLEKNLSVSKKKKNHGQRNKCSLLTNKDNGNNSSTTNTNKKINNKTMNTRKAKNNDNDDTDHHGEGSNNVTNDINLVPDNMISKYCKDNWPKILEKLADPLKGPEVLECILRKKAYDHLILQPTVTKFNIQLMKLRNDNWRLKCEALESKMKTLIESKNCEEYTRQLSIKNQNQMDTTLCKNIGVGEKEINAGTNKISYKTD